MLKTIDSVERFMTKLVELILVVMFIVIFIMVFYQVVLRYVFNMSIFGTAEVFTMLYAYCSALGAAVMCIHSEHIRVSVFTNVLPVRLRRIVFILNNLLVILFSYFIVRESIPWLISIRDFRSQVTGISRAVESIAIPVSFTLIIFYSFVKIIRLIFDHSDEVVREEDRTETEIQELIQEAAVADRQSQEISRRRRATR